MAPGYEYPNQTAKAGRVVASNIDVEVPTAHPTMAGRFGDIQHSLSEIEAMVSDLGNRLGVPSPPLRDMDEAKRTTEPALLEHAASMAARADQIGQRLHEILQWI